MWEIETDHIPRPAWWFRYDLLLLLLLLDLPGGAFAFSSWESHFDLLASAGWGAEFAGVYGEEHL